MEEEHNEPIDEIIKSLEDKQKRDEIDFINFLNLFKSLNINLSLLELIDKIPKYAKYLKEIMAQHKKMKKGKQINIDASCSTLIYLGSFTIPIDIGDRHFNKDLFDLGANINLMPLTIYQKLRVGDLKNTSVMLQLVDRSLVHLTGVLEDVLVKIWVLDFVEDQDMPILLGKPFLAMSKSTIGLGRNKLIMKIDGKIEVLKCGHDSQNEGLVRDECCVIRFNH
ncbi:Aspartic peptidase [Gossypium australe]|uniref:Aspartic peptidase n=1 Tax=Gossypium australe TaxID=47621 RepID=A0A5B6UZ04_9ROSI|nr:Aspartic peptidase [Gossypium australe]